MNDHLEVIGPSGDVAFFDLNAPTGVTSIGRAETNDLRLPSATVADYAATLDHRQQPFTIMALTDVGAVRVNGRTLRAHEFSDLHPWDSIELDGYVLILAPADESGVVAGAVAGAALAGATVAGTTGAGGAGVPLALAPDAEAGAAGANGGGAGAGNVPADVPPTGVTPGQVTASAATGAAAGTLAGSAVSASGETVVAAAPAAAILNASLPQLGPPLAPKNDPLIYAVMPERLQQVDVQTPGQWQFTMTNASTLVSRFQLRVEGWVDSSWFVFDDNEFTLLERESRLVTVTAVAPRTPASVAGAHHFAVIISSDNLPGHETRLPATLTINPYYEYGVEPLQPVEKTIPWRRRNASFVMPLQNRGNSLAHYRIEAVDRENATRIEFVDENRLHLGMREIAIPAATEVELPILVTPAKRRLIGAGGRKYDMTVTVTPLEGALGQFPTRGELRHKPLFGRWIILLLAMLLGAAVLLIFRPRVQAVRLTYVNQAGVTETKLSNADQFAATSGLVNMVRARLGLTEAAESGEAPADGAVAGAVTGAVTGAVADGSLTDATVRAGELLTVTWETRNGNVLAMGFLGNTETSLVTVDNPASVRRGSYPFVPLPNIGTDNNSAGPTLYELRMENWMTRLPLISALGQVSRPLVVQVIPANAPIIDSFVVNTNTTVLGNDVVVSWNATMPNPGDQLMLEQRQGEEVVASQVLTASAGSLTFEPVANTEFRLVPSTNVWIGASQPSAATESVSVLIPTPTLVPTPDIRGFLLEPAEVIAGGSVTITYAISGSTISSLRFFGLPTPQIDLEFESGRVAVPVPSPGPFNVALVAVRLPDGSTDPADPAAARVTAVASRVAVAPTPTPTPTFTLTPTPTPQIPVIEVLNISPVEITRGAPEDVLLTWQVIGDMDQIAITAPDFSITSLEKQASISVPRDQTRVFVLTVMLDGEAAASKSVELKVNEPTPTPVPPTPVPPPPPPPPTETPTATPTQVPNPAIISFAATSDLPVSKEVDANGNDIFFVPGGAEVIVSWEVQNATTVELRELSASGDDRLLTNRLAKDQIVITALEDLTYIMTAYNNPGGVDVANPALSGQFGSVARTMRVQLNAAQQFDPPTNVQWSRGGDGIDNENDPVIVTWEYNPQQTEGILGFRIYKAPAGSSSFVRLVDEATLTNTTRTYTDEQKPLCDQAYFIVAVYQDLTKPGADKTVETDAGADSYITPPCGT